MHPYLRTFRFRVRRDNEVRLGYVKAKKVIGMALLTPVKQTAVCFRVCRLFEVEDDRRCRVPRNKSGTAVVQQNLTGDGSGNGTNVLLAGHISGVAQSPVSGKWMRSAMLPPIRAIVLGWLLCFVPCSLLRRGSF